MHFGKEKAYFSTAGSHGIAGWICGKCWIVWCFALFRMQAKRPRATAVNESFRLKQTRIVMEGTHKQYRICNASKNQCIF